MTPPSIACNGEDSSESKDCNLNVKPTATGSAMRFLGMQSMSNISSNDLLKVKNRNSYCGGGGGGATGGIILHHNRIVPSNWDDSKSIESQQLMVAGERSEPLNTKLAVTPSSPMQSPRYSLLVATGTDTSSENSSALNTPPPPHELDPLLFTSGMSTVSGLSLASTSSNQIQQLLLRTDYLNSYLNSSRESLDISTVRLLYI